MTKIACIGDSITWGFLVPARQKNSYPAVLQQLLGEGFEVKNFGYNDASVEKHADTPYWTKGVYRKSLEWNPDIVLIMLGTNDTKKHNWDPVRFRADYNALIDSYESLPSHPKVILCTPPRMYEIFDRVLWGLWEDTLEGEVIPAVREIAESRGLPLIDAFQSINDQSMMVDGIHPGRKGAQTLASFIHGHLQQYK